MRGGGTDCTGGGQLVVFFFVQGGVMLARVLVGARRGRFDQDM